ncbi:MAG: hypothetical protein HN580_00370 [Deltaproteobacteria bacterium]|nr:hypothetical protein [Deltaproteobacteria bacterium]MBT7154630.1 hypothetical protein [Deltaproteobacteria bacterium]MBT7887453.1 hypothetical protein [Deltaproteobacteria bacterium]
MILKNLKKYALSNRQEASIADVRIGLSYTAVRLNNGSVGVAMTFHKDIPHGCLPDKTPMIGKKAGELIEKADSQNILERTVAIATINATLNRNRPDLKTGDVLEILNPGKDDIVGMVGFFGPLVPKLKSQVKKLYIFEKSTSKSEGLLSEEKAFDILPECTIALITSTSLINLSFEKIVETARNCRKVVLVGSSTPLAPDVFKAFGVDILSGIIVTDHAQVLRIVSESGGMKSFGRFVNKVNSICE